MSRYQNAGHNRTIRIVNTFCERVSVTVCLRMTPAGCTRWFKYDRDDLCVNKSQFVPVIFEPPCICEEIKILALGGGVYSGRYGRQSSIGGKTMKKMNILSEEKLFLCLRIF